MKPRSRFRGLTLFVTVGSTRFDQLIKELMTDESAEQLIELGFNRIIMQVGESEYKQEEVLRLETVHNLQIDIYKYKSSISDDIEAADLTIGHAGAGTCLEVLRMNRRLLIVVNNNLMDNHQSELADQLAADNYVVQTTIEDLHKNLNLICDSGTKLDKFPAQNRSKFEEIFNEALKKVSSRL